MDACLLTLLQCKHLEDVRGPSGREWSGFA